MVNPVPDYISLAQQCYDRGDYRGAISHCNQTLYLNSKDERAYLYRGIVFHEMKYYQGAIADYTEALSINSYIVCAYYYRGLARSEMGDYQGAIADYDRGIAIDPEDLAYKYENPARIFHLDTSNNEVEDGRIYPNLALAYYNRGIARYNLGDKQGAIEDYSQAITLHPSLAEAYSNRGNTRASLGDREGAISDYDRAIRINPNLAETYGSWGIALAEMGKKQEAIEYLEKAADFFQQQGNLESYEKVINRIFELKHDLSSKISSPTTLSHLALEEFIAMKQSKLDDSEETFPGSIVSATELNLGESEENSWESENREAFTEFALDEPTNNQLTNSDNTNDSFEDFTGEIAEDFSEFSEVQLANSEAIFAESTKPTSELNLGESEENSWESENREAFTEFALDEPTNNQLTNSDNISDSFEEFTGEITEEFTELNEVQLANSEAIFAESTKPTSELNLGESEENSWESENLEAFTEFALDEPTDTQLINIDNINDSRDNFTGEVAEEFPEFSETELGNIDEIVIESTLPASEVDLLEKSIVEFKLEPDFERAFEKDNFDAQLDEGNREINLREDKDKITERETNNYNDNNLEESAPELDLENDEFDDIFSAYFTQEDSEIDDFGQIDLDNHPLGAEENLENFNRLFNNNSSEEAES
jgi:tetratricopeptide (TPR) repeat protein